MKQPPRDMLEAALLYGELFRLDHLPGPPGHQALLQVGEVQQRKEVGRDQQAWGHRARLQALAQG